MEQDNSGPAFPVGRDLFLPGMTLRDYFAAKVLQGLCAKSMDWDDADEAPAIAYLMADSMMKAREL